jgi:hypothetical protein
LRVGARHLRREEARDDAQFGAFGLGAVGAASALAKAALGG